MAYIGKQPKKLGAGGGGASALTDLTDVTITSVANNDLLMYNSVATEWQNTNLGVSVTPTLTGAASINSTLTYTLTVSNHATYDDPAYYVEVYTGSTLVVANSAVTDNGDGTLTFVAPAAGTHEIRVRCQDFGDLQSEIATKALTTSTFSVSGRYWRIKVDGVILLSDWAMHTAVAQGGTKYPTDMTSNVLPTPFVASGSYAYSATYDYFKAFDNQTQGWWTLSSSSPTTDYLAIDLGASYTIKSFQFRSGSQSGSLANLDIYYGDAADWSDETLALSITDMDTVSTVFNYF